MKKQQLQIKIKPTDKQDECWQLLKDGESKFIFFGGGAGGGKSWLGCEWLLIMCLQYPGSKWFIGRNELKRLMASTYVTWIKVTKFHNVPKTLWKLNSQYNYIEFWNGSRIDLLDVAYQPRDPLYERFGSTEYSGGWLEEVGEIKERAFDVLKSRIGRHQTDEMLAVGMISKMFLTCNPKKNWTYHLIYKPWRENELDGEYRFIQSLYKDNPFTADEYEKNLRSIKDKVLRERLMNGNWEYEYDDANLMEYDKIVNMFRRPFDNEMNGEFYLSVDVARFGRDKAVIILWQGLFIKKIWYYNKSSSTFLKEKIQSKCAQFHIGISNVVIDEDGVGGGLVDELYGCKGFVNGSRAVEDVYEDVQETDRYSFKNLRSQCYFKLADLITDGKVGCYEDIDPEIKNWLLQELEAIRRKDVENNEKKLQVIGKDEIKEIIGRSPDFADSLMMRMYYELGMQSNVEIGIVW